jgi:hypothetical protein
MKSLTFALVAAALLAIGVSQAVARPAHAQATKTVTVAMHDPGCHWFAVGNAYKTTLTVKGPIKLRNIDEAALKVVGPAGTKLEAVCKQLALGRGTYHITMVGQAPDDNHLKLVVT